MSERATERIKSTLRWILLVAGSIEFAFHIFQAIRFEEDPTIYALFLWIPVLAVTGAFQFRKKGEKLNVEAIVVLIFIMSVIALLTQAYSWLARPESSTTINSPESTLASNAAVKKPDVETLLSLVNTERTKAGVSPLIIDNRLNMSAQIKADDMNRNNYFSHVDGDGKQGYSYVFETAPGECVIASENITDNIHVNDSESAIAAWVSSPSHYAAMVSPDYTLTGFGISGTKIVEHFCKQN